MSIIVSTKKKKKKKTSIPKQRIINLLISPPMVPCRIWKIMASD